MWSPKAEEVVSRLIAATPPDPLDPHAARLGALFICACMWAGYYLRPNGEVVIVGDDFDYPDVDTVYTDWDHLLFVLVRGARRFPELREFLPVRSGTVIDCDCQRHPLFANGTILCPECKGLGWLEPTHDQADKPAGGGIKSKFARFGAGFLRTLFGRRVAP